MDDLTRPLGQTRIEERPRRGAKLLLALFAGALCLPLATFAGWAMFAPDRLGGEPVAHASVKPGLAASAANAQPPAAKVIPTGSPSVTRQTSAPDGRSTVTIIDGSSGRRQDVMVPNL
ncbi:MAG TPA: hypothetical protein VH684_11985 [Xanthobacteraceae bacterium]|jgi:hypothetical protein